MAAASCFPPLFAAFAVSYCTPFFPTCKAFFADFAEFFKNFFYRRRKRPENPMAYPPKSRENRLYQPSQAPLKYPRAQKQRRRIPQAHIAPADGKMEIYPYPQRRPQKEDVRRCGGFPAQRTQKTIPGAQSHAQQQPAGEPSRRHRGSAHPKRRRRKLPAGLGSS